VAAFDGRPTRQPSRANVLENSAKSGIRARATIITRTLALLSSGTEAAGAKDLLLRADASQ
jgi:hypothetical protein